MRHRTLGTRAPSLESPVLNPGCLTESDGILPGKINVLEAAFVPG
jgi:hypothetical protein